MGGQPQWPVVALVLIGATLASATDCWNIVAKAKTKIQAQRITPKWHECGPESGHDFKTMFEHWKTHHNKTYVDAAQEEKAFARWRHNMVEVAKINHDPDLSWFASGNRYSDQDHDELTRQMAAKQQDLKDLFTGWVTQDHLNTSNTKPGTRRQLLASRVDWNAAGKVTPPKWQGDCGACWAACAASAIESSYLISQGLTVKQVPNFILSEQQLYDCVDGRYNTPDNPCAGGDSGQALIYAADHRVGTIDVYPLQFANGVSSNGYRRVCKEKSVGPGEGVRFGGSGSYVASQNEQALMAAVAVEPVITYYAAGGSFWRYAGGVYRDTNCPNSINHAMLITGYDAKARTWTLKNSWASGWGDDGYLHVPMTGDNNGFCMMQTFLLSPSMVFAEKWAGGTKTVVAAGNKEPTSVRRKSPPPKRRSTLVKPPKKKPPPPPRGARATRKPAPPRPPPRHRVY